LTSLPDLTGFLQEDAERILKEAGADFTLSETTTPRGDVEGDEMRVVRQVIRDGKVEITMCRYKNAEQR